jgi:hypothetical protein
MTIERRFQVFVSSTYEDLILERREIIQALLELDCIPAGMELFPAADDDQWTLIKRVIDACDYYLLVIAGRYGSVSPTGKSYTEMEYEYAVERKKPVIAFLHKDPASLPAKWSEKTDEGRTRLNEFRATLERRMCRYWTSPAELGSVVSRSLIKLVKTNPAMGWVRGDQVPDVSSVEEILTLKTQVEKLNAELAQLEGSAPKGTEHFSQENDKVPIHFGFEYHDSADPTVFKATWQLPFTWNEMFARIAPLMIDEAADHLLISRLNEFIFERAKERLKLHGDDWAKKTIAKLHINDDDFRGLIVQYRALNLIVERARTQRMSGDTATYFHLTSYGDRLMTNLRAVTKKQVGAMKVQVEPIRKKKIKLKKKSKSA